MLTRWQVKYQVHHFFVSFSSYFIDLNHIFFLSDPSTVTMIMNNSSWRYTSTTRTWWRSKSCANLLTLYTSLTTKLLGEYIGFTLVCPSVCPSCMPCPLSGLANIWLICFICGTNTTHEWKMCHVPFTGQRSRSHGSFIFLVVASWHHMATWIYSTLAQVMACCLMAPIHYPKQCWRIISGSLHHSPDNNFTGSPQDINS